MNDPQLSHELEPAARQAIEARTRAEETPPHSAAYQSAVKDYLRI